MPIYEYACGSCEHRFETIHKASEAPLRDCPECGDSALKKLISAPVFRLKGSGWYETDFKSKDRKNVAGDGADGGKDGEAGKSAETGNGEKSESSKNGKAESAKGSESKTKDGGGKSTSGGDGGSKTAASKSD